MRVFKKLILIILPVLSVACSSKQDTDERMGKNIKFSPEISEINEKDIQISFFQPEETEEALIGSVSVICEFEDNVYIGDDQNNQLLKFNKDGHFIGEVGSVGQGVGEYVALSYFFIDKDSETIGILDEDQQKILYYRIKDNEYTKTQSFPQILSNCCVPFNNGLLWYNQNFEGTNSDKYFVSTDTDNNISDSFISKEFKSGYFTGSSCPLFQFNNKIFGFTPYDLKLYEFENKDVTIKYDISIDGFQTPPVDYLNKISDNGTSVSLFSKLRQSEYISYYSINMCSSLLVVNVIRKGEKYIGLLDRQNDKTSFMLLSDFAKTIGVGEISYFIPNTIDDSILCIIEKESIRESVEKKKSDLDERLFNLINSDNENPIIIKIKL